MQPKNVSTPKHSSRRSDSQPSEEIEIESAEAGTSGVNPMSTSSMSGNDDGGSAPKASKEDNESITIGKNGFYWAPIRFKRTTTKIESNQLATVEESRCNLCFTYPEDFINDHKVEQRTIFEFTKFAKEVEAKIAILKLTKCRINQPYTISCPKDANKDLKCTKPCFQCIVKEDEEELNEIIQKLKFNDDNLKGKNKVITKSK